MSDAPAPEYLTVEELAGRLQISVRTLTRWVKADPSMPAFRCGGVLRFHRERIERWLRDHEQGQARPRLRAVGGGSR